MDQTEQLKQFLEEQLKWCKERDFILEQIELKLYEMKDIAEYARDHEVSELELEMLNHQINQLKIEVELLEQQ